MPAIQRKRQSFGLLPVQRTEACIDSSLAMDSMVGKRQGIWSISVRRTTEDTPAACGRSARTCWHISFTIECVTESASLDGSSFHGDCTRNSSLDCPNCTGQSKRSR